VIQFYDSADLAGIPQTATHLAAYHDGIGQTSQAHIARTLPNVRHVRWITVQNDPHSGIADFEPGTPVYQAPGMLRQWAAGRHSLDMSTPVVYCDRANARLAMDRLHGLTVLWWISVINPAHPQDQHPWTPYELAADLAAHWSVALHGNIWACQWENTPGYDLSDLFLGWWA
jgi:hypothetical protein